MRSGKVVAVLCPVQSLIAYHALSFEYVSVSVFDRKRTSDSFESVAGKVPLAVGCDAAGCGVQRHKGSSEEVRLFALKCCASGVCGTTGRYGKHHGILLRLTCVRRLASWCLSLQDVWQQHSEDDERDDSEMS